MRNRFRIFVRNLIARHESWYLRVNNIINHLKVFEIRKSRNKLIETKKLFRVLNFWLKLSMWIELSVFWWRMQIYAKYLKSKSLQLIKKLTCSRLVKNVNDNVNDEICKRLKICFFQNLVRNLECKKSKIRAFECNEIINANVWVFV